MVVIGGHPGVDIVHGEQAARDPRVLNGNHVGGPEHGDGALAQILGVADRGGDQIKAGLKRRWLAFTSARSMTRLRIEARLSGRAGSAAAILGNGRRWPP